MDQTHNTYQLRSKKDQPPSPFTESSENTPFTTTTKHVQDLQKKLPNESTAAQEPKPIKNPTTPEASLNKQQEQLTSIQNTEKIAQSHLQPKDKITRQSLANKQDKQFEVYEDALSEQEEAELINKVQKLSEKLTQNGEATIQCLNKITHELEKFNKHEQNLPTTVTETRKHIRTLQNYYETEDLETIPAPETIPSDNKNESTYNRKEVFINRFFEYKDTLVENIKNRDRNFWIKTATVITTIALIAGVVMYRQPIGDSLTQTGDQVLSLLDVAILNENSLLNSATTQITSLSQDILGALESMISETASGARWVTVSTLGTAASIGQGIVSGLSTLGTSLSDSIYSIFESTISLFTQTADHVVSGVSSIGNWTVFGQGGGAILQEATSVGPACQLSCGSVIKAEINEAITQLAASDQFKQHVIDAVGESFKGNSSKFVEEIFRSQFNTTLTTLIQDTVAKHLNGTVI